MNGPNNPIGWCDYTWNPVKGKCPVACPYCYARRIYDRFHYDPTIRMDAKEFMAVRKVKKPARIFVGSTIELFGKWIRDNWIYAILEQAMKYPQHIFQFLTQFPNAMCHYTFPENCWCGTTITANYNKTDSRLYPLTFVNARILFLSLEPIHGFVSLSMLDLKKISWIIIGAETGNRKGKIKPREEWIRSAIHEADVCDIPVFMKNNLKPYWHGELRQEFPES